jgi:hydroxymethylpyrimidine kinase/phosphomethylpyrimidine kinase
MRTVLTIAGFDPSAGAGVLADIKTIDAMGLYGVAAITSITFQNTKGVFGVRHQNAADVRRQCETLQSDFEIAAIKTGMLPIAAIVEAAAGLAQKIRCPLVVDPVIVSSSGYSLIEPKALDAIRQTLMPLATLVTPNSNEAEMLTGLAVCDVPSMTRAATLIREFGPEAALVTGGDLEGDSSIDVLVDSRGTRTYESRRVYSTSTHGTGCALSTAVACYLADGLPLRDAVLHAKRFVTSAIESAVKAGGGRGPLNHRSGTVLKK